MNKTAISHVNVVDVLKNVVRKNQTILIEEGKIIKVASSDIVTVDQDYLVIDGSGKTALPGLIDAHLHLLQSGVDDFLKPYSEGFKKKIERNLLANLKSGVTTVRNMPGGQNLKVHKVRDDIIQGKRVGPRILSSGPALSAPYGYFSTKMFFPFPAFIRFILKKLYKVTSLSIDVASKEEAVKAIKTLKKQGVDFVKTTTTGTYIPYANDDSVVEDLMKRGMKKETIFASMDKDVLKTIIDEASKVDLKVAAHTIYDVKDFKLGAMLGLRSIEHTPFGEIDGETFDIMKKHHVYWVPTAFAPVNFLKLLESDTYYDDIMKDLPKPLFELGKKSILNTKALLKNDDPLQTLMVKDITKLVNHYIPFNIKKAMHKNVPIVAAVDAGASGAGYVPHGMLHKELLLYTSLGMSTMDAIKTATINPAHLLGLENEIGSIDEGKTADIILCKDNPVEDINHLTTISHVFLKGVAII